MIYALVVIYNKKCEESISLRGLEEYKNKNIKIIVFDNSDKDLGNENYCNKKQIQYYTMKKNIGLSKAYNYVINKLEEEKREGFMLLLDDDTELNEQYINEIISRTEKDRKSEIIVPIVKSNDKIISPSNIIHGCRVKSIKDINEIDINRITAINSGMVVNLEVYKKIKYNEKMFLDYVDHEFCKEARKNNIKIDVLETELKQSFSREDKTIELKNVLKRLKIYKKDFKIYCYENVNGSFYYFLNILKLILIYTIRYRSFRFFELLIK